MLADALRRLGFIVTQAGPAEARPIDAGACFAHTVGGELLIENRKVVGSAQLRRGTALLQHGSVLLHDDQEMLAGLSRGIAQCPGGVLPSSLLPGRFVGTEELSETIAISAASRWRGVWSRVLDPGSVVRASSRLFPAFQSPTWTWVR